MKLREITELIQRTPDGGVISDRSRWDQGYLEATVNIFRARLLKAIYAKNNRINPVCYQKFYPVYEKDLQDNKCSVKFRHPEVISFDSGSDGFRYIGALSFNKQYPRIKSRSWLTTYNDNQVTNISSDRRTTVLYDGDKQILEVYGNMEIKELMTECIMADPLSIPTYNKSTDPYPLNDDLIPDLLAMIFQEETGIAARVPIPGTQPIAGAGAGRRNR